MVVDDDFLTMIDDYRFSHRLKSRNSAINELVQKGMTQVLAEMGKEKPRTNYRPRFVCFLRMPLPPIRFQPSSLCWIAPVSSATETSAIRTPPS